LSRSLAGGKPWRSHEGIGAYDPDRYRLPVGTIVLLVLLCFIAIAWLSLADVAARIASST